MRTILAAGALALLLSSCGSGDGGTMPPPPPGSTVLPSIGVGVSGAANITRGSNAEVTVTVFRLAGPATSIDVTAEGLPAGVTAAFAPASVPATSTTSTLTLSATSSATLGTIVVAVRARATGAIDATTPLVISVSP